MSMKNEVQTAALISILSEEDSRRLLVPRCDDGETIRFYPCLLYTSDAADDSTEV